MRQLRIEVYGVPAYCMNNEEFMNVKVEADGKPWYHDIRLISKTVNTHPVQRTTKSSSGAWLANFS